MLAHRTSRGGGGGREASEWPGGLVVAVKRVYFPPGQLTLAYGRYAL